MKSKILLRIAAIVMLLHCVGHTIGVATWQSPKSGVPIELITKMQAVQFVFMDKADSTMAGFYTGFGYTGTILMLLIVALLWVFSTKKDKTTIQTLWIVGIATVMLAVIEIIYFFPMATAFCIFTALLIFSSIYLINREINK